MTSPARTGAVRPLSHGMRWLLYAAAALVFLAGFQLFILSELTATYFAWTVAPSLTAASLGAAYWAAVPVEFLAARKATWAAARIAVPGVWTFTTLTLVLTLLHFGRFHFSSPDAVPQLAAWLWLAIYAGVPVAMLVALLVQVRTPGGDAPRALRLPIGTRLAFLVEGSGMTVTGLALFLVPTTASPVWPWTLTALTARAIGAWLLGIGVITFHAVWEDDLARIRPMGGGYALFALLELVALARYPGDMAWSAPGAWLYLAFLVSLLPLGLDAWFGPGVLRRLGRRTGSAPEP